MEIMIHNKKLNRIEKILIILIFIILIIVGVYFNIKKEKQTSNNTSNNEIISYQISDLPEYSWKSICLYK
ncbi:MAG: hypothetical protein IJH39_09185 [Clostridia bacterium]|nr:hypothetical protein [Clostridia bacterium]